MAKGIQSAISAKLCQASAHSSSDQSPSEPHSEGQRWGGGGGVTRLLFLGEWTDKCLVNVVL